jgi:hypothetical protein
MEEIGETIQELRAGEDAGRLDQRLDLAAP